MKPSDIALKLLVLRDTIERGDTSPKYWMRCLEDLALELNRVEEITEDKS